MKQPAMSLFVIEETFILEHSETCNDKVV